VPDPKLVEKDAPRKPVQQGPPIRRTREEIVGRSGKTHLLIGRSFVPTPSINN